MIISRWQAEIIPNREQIIALFNAEMLNPTEEVFLPQQKIQEHRHPFCEVRMIVDGELLFNISGNQILLRPGDRVEIPANTKHFYSTQGTRPCLSIYGKKVI